MTQSGLKPHKIFYGWWLVGASVLVGMYMAAVIFYGFTAFIEPMAEELGWSYTKISLGASLRGLEGGLLAPIFGILIDRWGPRRLIFLGAILLSLGLFLLSRTTANVLYSLHCNSFGSELLFHDCADGDGC